MLNGHNDLTTCAPIRRCTGRHEGIAAAVCSREQDRRLVSSLRLRYHIAVKQSSKMCDSVWRMLHLILPH